MLSGFFLFFQSVGVFRGLIFSRRLGVLRRLSSVSDKKINRCLSPLMLFSVGSVQRLRPTATTYKDSLPVKPGFSLTQGQLRFGVLSGCPDFEPGGLIFEVYSYLPKTRNLRYNYRVNLVT